MTAYEGTMGEEVAVAGVGSEFLWSPADPVQQLEVQAGAGKKEKGFHSAK